jgi:hypothetical protein
MEQTKKIDEFYGEWSYTQTYIIFQIWLRNRGFIKDTSIDFNMFAFDEEYREIYNKWLEDCWLIAPFPLRCLTAFNELRCLNFPLFIEKLHSSSSSKSTDSFLPDYLEVLERDYTGNIKSYRNKITGIIVDSGRSIDIQSGRRFGKTNFFLVLVIGLMQLPQFYGKNIPYLIPSESKGREFFIEFSNFFKEVCVVKGYPLLKENLGELSFTGQYGLKFKIESWKKKGQGRGVNSLFLCLDEPCVADDETIASIITANASTLAQSYGFIIPISSPSENDINVLMKKNYYDTKNTFSISLPSLANVSTNITGDFLYEGESNWTSAFQNLFTSQPSEDVILSVILGYPLPDNLLKVFNESNFDYFSFNEIHNTTLEVRSDRIKDILENENVEIAVKRRVKNRYDGLIEGGKPSNILFSILIADTSKSGVGDNSVFIHLGIGKNGNYYILNVLRKPLRFDQVAEEYVWFLFTTLESDYGDTLRWLYIEDTSNSNAWFNTITAYVDTHFARHSLVTGSLYSKEEETLIKERLKKVGFGVLNPKGGNVSSEGIKISGVVDAPTLAKMKNMYPSCSWSEMRSVSFTGSKTERATTAVVALCRPNIYNETKKVIFYPYYTNNAIIEDTIKECIKEATSFIKQPKGKTNTVKDDFVDTITYGILVTEAYSYSDEKALDKRINGANMSIKYLGSKETPNNSNITTNKVLNRKYQNMVKKIAKKNNLTLNFY